MSPLELAERIEKAERVAITKVVGISDIEELSPAERDVIVASLRLAAGDQARKMAREWLNESRQLEIADAVQLFAEPTPSYESLTLLLDRARVEGCQAGLDAAARKRRIERLAFLLDRARAEGARAGIAAAAKEARACRAQRLGSHEDDCRCSDCHHVNVRNAQTETVHDMIRALDPEAIARGTE